MVHFCSLPCLSSKPKDLDTDVIVFMQLILSVHTIRGQVVALFNVDLIILFVTLFCCTTFGIY